MNRGRETDEIDVRQLLKAIRDEVKSDREDEISEVGVLSQNTDLQIMRDNYDIRQYDLATDRKLGALVVGMKKIVEAVVKPYAGHFLDKQAHFNAALNRLLTGFLTRLDALNDQFVALREEQKEIKELITCEMTDVRTRIDALRGELAERSDSLESSLSTRIEEQTKRLITADDEARTEIHKIRDEIKSGVTKTKQEMKKTRENWNSEFTCAVDDLRTRLAAIEKQTVESQKDVEKRVSRELEAVIDFIEEILTPTSK